MYISAVSNTHAFNNNANNSQTNDFTKQLHEAESLSDKTADEKKFDASTDIKSAYQTALNIDLARHYYQQQQKVIDTFLQQSTEEDSSRNSALKAVNDFYANMEKPAHIDDVAQLPEKNEDIKSSIEEQLYSQSLVHEQNPTVQMNTYYNIMKPANQSFLHILA